MTVLHYTPAVHRCSPVKCPTLCECGHDPDSHDIRVAPPRCQALGCECGRCDHAAASEGADDGFEHDWCPTCGAAL